MKIYQVIDDDCTEGTLFVTKKGVIKYLKENGFEITSKELSKSSYHPLGGMYDTTVKIHNCYE